MSIVPAMEEWFSRLSGSVRKCAFAFLGEEDVASDCSCRVPCWARAAGQAAAGRCCAAVQCARQGCGAGRGGDGRPGDRPGQSLAGDRELRMH